MDREFLGNIWRWEEYFNWNDTLSGFNQKFTSQHFSVEPAIGQVLEMGTVRPGSGDEYIVVFNEQATDELGEIQDL